MKKFFKYLILNIFLRTFEKETDNVEPEVDKFFADLIIKYI